MKQRITAKQFQELTEEQKQRLREWWKPEVGDIAVIRDGYLSHGQICIIDNYIKEYNDCSFIVPSSGYGSHDKEAFEPLLSIGQMIELLSANKDVFDIGKCYSLYSFRPYGEQTTKQDKELCDTLWEAVKRLL